MALGRCFRQNIALEDAASKTNGGQTAQQRGTTVGRGGKSMGLGKKRHALWKALQKRHFDHAAAKGSAHRAILLGVAVV
eukprot:353449-Chlamydomonas_euryale.AAC.3